MGGPTIGMADKKIIMSGAGASLQNLHLRSTTASTTVPFITISAADVELKDVTFTCSASQERILGVQILAGGDNYVIADCKFDKSIGGINNSAFILADEGSGLVQNCYFELGIVATHILNCIREAKNCRIEGCLLILTSGGAGATHYGMFLHSECVCVGNVIRAVDGSGVSLFGILFHSTGNIVVCNNRIGTSGYELNVGISGPSNRIVTQNNHIYVHSGSGASHQVPIGIACSGGADTTISGNYINVTQKEAVIRPAFGIQLTINADLAIRWVATSNRIYVKNNHNNAGSGVYGIYVTDTTPASAVDVTISVNSIECVVTTNGTGAGVWVADASAGPPTPRTSYSVAISGNTVRTTSGDLDGVSIDASDVTITGNHLKAASGVSAELISVQSTNCVVVGNILNGVVANKAGANNIVANNLGDP
jgi:hypothetical protein